jgi:DNA repair protein RecN (Recombination protein N)
MLQELSIRNFAIIDDLTIGFDPGLTVLSGETGAGKSILINAVNLLLGSRASATLIRTGCDSAELEALFLLTAGCPATQTMRAHGYDPDEGLIVRRIIARNDTNRIYINGRLSTIQVLTAITGNLASISGQHAHQSLLREDQHLLILDQFGELMPMRTAVADLHRELLPRIQALEALKSRRQRRSEQLELLEFQQQEIESVAIAPGEDSELEQEKIRLKNSEQLYRTAAGSIDDLYGAAGSVFERLSANHKILERTARLDPTLAPLAEQMADAAYRVEDIIGGLRNYLTALSVDEQRLEAVEERLDRLNRLKRKYGGSLENVSAHLEQVQRELQLVGSIDEQIAELESSLGDHHRKLSDLSRRLSEQRGLAAAALVAKVTTQLADLNMANSRFTVKLQALPADTRTPALLRAGESLLSESGVDRANFLIAPNVGESLKPLAAIASGGELSRVVLALKAILAQTAAVETIIFDEVDAGIGGGTAEVVGRKLGELARHHQVICITHLPQIAKFGDHHFNIAKYVKNGRTLTAIRPLDRNGRIEELARMLGGVEITPTTRAHARELLKR